MRNKSHTVNGAVGQICEHSRLGFVMSPVCFCYHVTGFLAAVQSFLYYFICIKIYILLVLSSNIL